MCRRECRDWTNVWQCRFARNTESPEAHNDRRMRKLASRCACWCQRRSAHAAISRRIKGSGLINYWATGSMDRSRGVGRIGCSAYLMQAHARQFTVSAPNWESVRVNQELSLADFNSWFVIECKYVVAAVAAWFIIGLYKSWYFGATVLYVTTSVVAPYLTSDIYRARVEYSVILWVTSICNKIPIAHNLFIQSFISIIVLF